MGDGRKSWGGSSSRKYDGEAVGPYMELKIIDSFGKLRPRKKRIVVPKPEAKPPAFVATVPIRIPVKEVLVQKFAPPR